MWQHSPDSSAGPMRAVNARSRFPGRRRMMRMRCGRRVIALVVLGTATAGCYNNRMCGPAVWAGSMLVGGAAVGGGVAAATDGDTGPTAGGAAGGVVAGAVLLAPWMYHLICHNEVTPPPPPPKQEKAPERKPIETLSGPNFDFDKSMLRPDGKVKVDHVVGLMNENATMRVSVEGHT